DRTRAPDEGHTQGDDGPGRTLAPHRGAARARKQQDGRRQIARHHARRPAQEAPVVRLVNRVARDPPSPIRIARAPPWKGLVKSSSPTGAHTAGYPSSFGG